MSTYSDLLPPNSTPLERALSGPTGRLTAIPTPIDALWRWDQCPENLLPWLAWALSVDFWDELWPEARKRAIIRESFELHRKKGTLYGIKRYLRYADAECLRALTPPDKAYAITKMTAAERDIWLSRFPQIRIYDYADRGVATRGAFTKGAWGLDKTFLGAGVSYASKPTCFPRETDAWERWGRRPFLWDQGPHPLATGVFKPLTWSARTNDMGGYFAYQFERLSISVQDLDALWLGVNAKGNRGRIDGRLFTMPSLAAKRVVTVALQKLHPDDLHKFAVPPSLEPIDVVPDKISERGTSRLGYHIFACFRGRWLDLETKTRKRVPGFVKGYLPPTSSRYRIYDRFALHDRDRLPNGKTATRHLGDIRLGMPAYHAELSVEIRGKRGFKQVNRYTYGFLAKSDLRHLHNARKAIVSAKSLRDKILMKTTLHKLVDVSIDTKVSSKTLVGKSQLLLT